MTAPSPGGAQRYGYAGIDWEERPIMEECPDGDWVRYGDIAGMEKERDHWEETAQTAITLSLKTLGANDELAKEVARLRKALELARSELVAILGIRPDFDGEDMGDDSVVAEEYIACFQVAQGVAGRAVHYIDKKAEALRGAAGEAAGG